MYSIDVGIFVFRYIYTVNILYVKACPIFMSWDKDITY